MEALPWLPRPLIIFALIAGKETPCVQWHGQDSTGRITEEQMLFPIYGHDAQYIECVRSDFWRISFLGSMDTWNEKNPDRPLAHTVEDEVMVGGSIPIIRMMANELFAHDTFALTCFVVQRGEQGMLYAPATYDNQDAYMELPRHECDKDLQAAWRRCYENPGNDDVESVVARMNFDIGYPGMLADRYADWRKEQDAREEAHRWG